MNRARHPLLVAALALAGCGAREIEKTSEAAPAVERCPEPEKVPVALPCDEPVEKNATGSRGDDKLELVPARFDALPGWADDRHGEALPALLASCARLAELADGDPIGVTRFAGRARDWRRPCAAAAAVPAGDHAAARAFFEAEFRAYAVRGARAGHTGKLTGYYVAALSGSRRRHGDYRWPIRKRPGDLVEVFLSDFIGDGRGRRIWGQRDPRGGPMRPYPTRAEVRARTLRDEDVLLWSDDPVGVAFAEIQGSGRVALDTGDEVWIAFDGKNGRRFRGIGGLMLRLGEIERGQGGVHGIRRWYARSASNAKRFPAILDLNEAMVFFKLSTKPGAIGTQQVVLTPGRSLAIDRALISFSTPVWVATRAPQTAGGPAGPWRRLLIAQDTGGSILGPGRGDIYFGAGDVAQRLAHRVNGPGRMWVLLPKNIVVPTR
jgi:membrane-bound lytic murein transglycosylase A